MKLLLSQINYSPAGKNYIENRLAVKLIMFWATCLLLALPWSVSPWQCSHQPQVSVHTPPSRNDVLSLAPGYLARIPKYWKECGIWAELHRGHLSVWMAGKMPTCLFHPQNREKQTLEKVFPHQLSPFWCVVTQTGGEEDFVYPKVNFSLGFWSFSGSAVSEAAANNLSSNGHISLVPNALI